MLTVRVRPGASRTSIGGRYGQGAQAAVVVAVTARPVDGAANEAVCRAVAAAFGLRPRQITLTSGATSRTKVLALDLDSAHGAQRLGELLGPGRP